MTKYEIEDVLSSIRRLVSEDATRKPVRAELLILTPELRVNDAGEAAPEAEAPAAPPAAEADAAKPATDYAAVFASTRLPEAREHELARQAQEPSLEERIASLESVIARSEEEFEPDGSEDLEPHIPRFILRPSASRTLPAEPVADAEPAPEAGAGDAAEAEAEAVAPAAEASPEPVEPEPPAAESAPPVEPPRPAREDRAELRRAAQAARERTHRGTDERPKPLPEAAPEQPAPAAPQATASADAEAALAERSERGVTVEEALIDEDALREIVSQLVREELRGELGERITRNVRRLIRREIHRAMSLQELTEDED